MTRESLEGMTIVGVVADVRQTSPSMPPEAEIYLPYLQHPGPGSSLALFARALSSRRCSRCGFARSSAG